MPAGAEVALLCDEDPPGVTLVPGRAVHDGELLVRLRRVPRRVVPQHRQPLVRGRRQRDPAVGQPVEHDPERRLPADQVADREPQWTVDRDLGEVERRRVVDRVRDQHSLDLAAARTCAALSRRAAPGVRTGFETRP
ncbi:MAG: hypothetical protein M3422_05060, partial [Actinomycetota bacterium]|nr:hypothetical protein [Actinomycetota bacterium]